MESYGWSVSFVKNYTINMSHNIMIIKQLDFFYTYQQINAASG